MTCWFSRPWRVASGGPAWAHEMPEDQAGEEDACDAEADAPDADRTQGNAGGGNQTDDEYRLSDRFPSEYLHQPIH